MEFRRISDLADFLRMLTEANIFTNEQLETAINALATPRSRTRGH
jgi:hypothetical protein